MEANDRRLRQRAGKRHRFEPGKAIVRTGRRWRNYAAAAAASLLCACAGMPSFLPGGDATKEQAAARYASPLPADPRHSRMTNRDIMLEWGTLTGERAQHKRKKSRDGAPPGELPDEPDDTWTIDEIMSNAVCRSCEEKPYHRMVVDASKRHGVPAGLIHAVIQTESSYNPAARSKRRARGLMQVTPATARFVGVGNSQRLYDPRTNIDTGTAYLKYLIANHATVDEALAAYNSGPGNVRKYKGVPPFRETRRYVRDVKRRYVITSR
ncbi:MAG TPA: lytic transglycosylase domain-containing protein [Paucimonas sp.]|nr:lytic transglycosylase domain-containing protein [Paucimonas sp.]